MEIHAGRTISLSDVSLLTSNHLKQMTYHRFGFQYVDFVSSFGQYLELERLFLFLSW